MKSPVVSRTRKPPKYTKVVIDYSKFLYQVVDRVDWGYEDKKTGEKKYTTANWMMELARLGTEGCWPQKLTRTSLHHHLTHPFLHYTSGRSSGFCLACLDFDAHHGQTDAFEAACWVRDSFFPGAYLEASARGYHLYVLIRMAYVKRSKFNLGLSIIADDLSDLLAQHGYTSTVEVLGGFTEWQDNQITSRAHLAPAPALPNGQADVNWLLSMPVFLPRALTVLHRVAVLSNEMEALLEEEVSRLPDDCLTAPPKPPKEAPTRGSECSWERMMFACYDYTVAHRQLPSEDDLLAYYQTRYGTDEADHGRRRRASYAIRYRAKTFDPALASTGGYEGLKPRLMGAVATHCVNRESGYAYGITDEDLAVALYTFHVASFSRHARPEEQWTVGNNAVSEMFAKLKAAGLTKRGCAQPNKAIALKTILLNAKLIECLDSRYVPANGKGISKKYTISTNHWLYHRWVRWAESVACKKVDQIMADKSKRSLPVVWESADQEALLA